MDLVGERRPERMSRSDDRGRSHSAASFVNCRVLSLYVLYNISMPTGAMMFLGIRDLK